MPKVSSARRLLSLLAVGLAVTPNASAQVVTPRTVPVLIGQQFDILPSHRGGILDAILARPDARRRMARGGAGVRVSTGLKPAR